MSSPSSSIYCEAAPPNVEAVCAVIGRILAAFTHEKCANYFKI